MEAPDEVGHIDASVFQNKVETLLTKSRNLLERQWKSGYDWEAQMIFVMRMGITINTYNAILYLVANKDKNPNRKPLVFAAAPLVRTLFEELFSLLLVLHNVNDMIASMQRTSYTELFIEKKEAERHYSDIPKWQAYIDTLGDRLDKTAKHFSLTEEQIANPRKYIGRWPTPGRAIQVVREKYPDSKVIPFMEFAHAWMYRTLSGESHLDIKAIHRRGHGALASVGKKFFGDDRYKEQVDRIWIDYHKEMTWTTYTLLLSIVSEIEYHFKFGMNLECLQLWMIFKNYSDLASDFFEKRYTNLL